jgi:hypothetical protein
MFTRLIATTEDKMACEYDLTISPWSRVDPETKVSNIRFVSDSGKSLVLEGWRRNMTFVEPHPMDQNTHPLVRIFAKPNRGYPIKRVHGRIAANQVVL